MKSIRTKIMAVILAGTVLSTFVVGGVSIVEAGKVAEKDAVKIMNLACADRVMEMDSLFQRIEQSVQAVSDYAMGQLKDVERFQTDGNYVDAYTEEIGEVLLNAADHTEGAIAVYIRYNPEFTSPVSGLFYSRDSSEQEFKRLTPTDFSQFDQNDVEHVGWYYVPVNNGKPTWMGPYMNKNIHTEMISYVIPLQVENVLVGIVGMDIDFGVVKRITDSARAFRTGYAFLADGQANIVYHPDYIGNTPLVSLGGGLAGLAARMSNGDEGELLTYRLKGQKKQAVIRTLRNDMNFVLTAPVKEIYAARNSLTLQILGGSLLVTAVMLALTMTLAQRMVLPLRELNEAAQKVAEGDLSVAISYRSEDEIGTLAESFRKTVEQLSYHINYVQGLAYRDSMTGVKSKTAYQEAVRRLDKAIGIERPKFGVVVFDLNGLKTVNDKYGHDFGDMLIIAASQIICKAFKHSPVYRIGGDEFVAIVEGADMEQYVDRLQFFQSSMDEYNQDTKPELRVIVARGIAIYNPETDLTYNDVFKRADSAMYRNKTLLKGEQ